MGLNNRITFLDSLRGIAILLVIFFHTFTRWTSLTTESSFQDFPLFKYGWMGVELFFLISGFVIFMTLDNCKTYIDFLKKRWLRLFPAMLIASILIYITSDFLYERPLGIPSIRDMLPGLTFTHPYFWQRLLGGDQGVLEGSFWSLYVEFIFYIIFGFLFFILKKKALFVLAALAIIGYLTFLLSDYSEIVKNHSYYINVLLGLKFYCWFTTGAIMFLYYKTLKKQYLLWLFLSCILCIGVSFDQKDIYKCFAGVCILLLFILPFFSIHITQFYNSKYLVFIGFISYPLYLIHEDALIALIIKLNHFHTPIPKILIPLFPLSILIFLSFIIAKYVEPPIKNFLYKIVFNGRFNIFCNNK